MTKIRPYLFLLYKLIVELFVVGFNVVRQVILPNRRRKGNVLSSLFLLFAGLADRLMTFRQNLLTTPWATTKRRISPRIIDAWIYSKKYLRQGMIIATWALFILSSFEWSGSAQSLPAQSQQETAESIQVPSRKCTASNAIQNSFTHRTVTAQVIFRPVLPSLFPGAKTWLRLCTIRI